MRFARTILAALIGMSIALIPVTGGSSAVTKPIAMSMANQTHMPCCPQADEGNGSVTCAFKCLDFPAVMFPTAVALTHVSDSLPSFVVDIVLHGHVSPPTHPPPI
jgi:hypothetical protein